MKSTLKREGGNFSLIATNAAGHLVFLDAIQRIGSKESAFSSMELLLDCLAGCSTMDILNILYKQKQHIEIFEIDIDADRYMDRKPFVFRQITLNILVKGKISESKLSRSISLTRDNYCLVYHILKHTSTITYRYEIEK